MASVSAAILAGGSSRRTGTNKALLQLEGQTFLERIIAQLGGFDELLLSVNKPDEFTRFGLPMVVDVYPGCGPTSGIYSALSACRSDYLLAVSCDIPFFTSQAAEYLCSYISDSYDVFPAVTRDGRMHPVCCVYSKRALPALRASLDRGELRIIDVIEGMRRKDVEFRHSAFSDGVLMNINDNAQYMQARRMAQGPPVVAISGVKNSGKTTFLQRLIPLLREAGLRVAVVKHDGHDFQPHAPGTDSHKLQQTGAELVCVYSDYRYAITKNEGGSLEAVLRQCGDVDLILLEGGKHSKLPKIELVRAAVSRSSTCAEAGRADTLLAICTDAGVQLPGVPSFALDDYAAVVGLLLRYCSGNFE